MSPALRDDLLTLTLAEYRALEAGVLHITNDLYERIVALCGWPR